MSKNQLLSIKSDFHQLLYPISDEAQMIYALLHIKPLDNNSPNGRLPLDLRFVLDRSGSMGEIASNMSKFDLLKKALKRITKRLQLNDYIQIISFDDDYYVDFDHTLITKSNQLKRLSRVISGLQLGGMTAMGNALEEALKAPITSDAITRIIIFTDGDINHNAKIDKKKCLKLASHSKEQYPFIVYAIGIDYDDDFLSELANLNNGRYEHISNMKRVEEIFDEEINMLGDITIRNLEMEIQSLNNIELKEINVLVPDIHSLNFSTNYCFERIGDVDKARGQQILLQLEVPAQTQKGLIPLARIKLTCDLPLQKIYGFNMEYILEAEFTDDMQAIKFNQNVLTTINLTGASKLYTSGLTQLNTGDLQTALQTLTQAANIYNNSGRNDLSTKIQTLTNTLKTKGKLNNKTEEIKRTLSTVTKNTIRN